MQAGCQGFESARLHTSKPQVKRPGVFLCPRSSHRQRGDFGRPVTLRGHVRRYSSHARAASAMRPVQETASRPAAERRELDLAEDGWVAVVDRGGEVEVFSVKVTRPASSCWSPTTCTPPHGGIAGTSAGSAAGHSTYPSSRDDQASASSTRQMEGVPSRVGS